MKDSVLIIPYKEQQKFPIDPKFTIFHIYSHLL